jgi:hypothetical protein
MTRTCDIIFRADDSPICTMTINITENDPNRIILNDLQHYFVNYNFKFSNGFEVVSIADFITSLEIKSNPFYNNKQLGTRYFSGIVLVKNQLTTAMVEMLLKSESELSRYTGTTTPIEYKKGIIMSIPNFSE